MRLKLAALPLPDLEDKAVLDCGTDFGWWAFRAALAGARRVVGLDRNRLVRGAMTDLIAMNRSAVAADPELRACVFDRQTIGAEWREHGRFDLILMLSVYHHAYALCGDHAPLWFWARRQIADDGHLLWEGPVGPDDPVVAKNVPLELIAGYSMAAIIEAARPWFDADYIGPAMHEPTRFVWRFIPKSIRTEKIGVTLRDGAGGATRAFLHADGRRVNEIETAIGYRPFAGSLNLECDEAFDWTTGYVRARVHDVADRSAGLDGEWRQRWARFYPVVIDGMAAHAFRFEGETYAADFVELIAPERLRHWIAGPRATLSRETPSC